MKSASEASRALLEVNCFFYILKVIGKFEMGIDFAKQLKEKKKVLSKNPIEIYEDLDRSASVGHYVQFKPTY